MDAIEKKINQHELESLSARVLKEGLWDFTLRIVNRGLGFCRTIILARLLTPGDFGLFGVAMLAIATLETFSQTGFHSALIQKQDNVESYLDTAWTVSALRGILLFLLLFLFAPSIAKFFNSPEASLVIKVIAISTLLSGFRNIGILFFQKELEFSRQFVYEFTATIVDLVVAISLAFLLKNVWALVWAGLMANVARLFMSYTLHEYRPKLRFDKGKFQDLFGFGKWVFGSSLLMFLITQGDDVFVGKVLGLSALGLYQMAYLLSNLPATEITHVISKVTFPAYSKLQDDLPNLKEAYLKVFQLTAYLSIPVAGIIFFLAHDFTLTFLGEKWLAMVPAVQILALWGMIRSLGATTGPVFHSTGKPRILTLLQLAVLIFLIIFIFPLTINYGILGTSIAIIISTIIPNIVAFYITIKIIDCDSLELLYKIFPTLLNSIITLLSIYILHKYYFYEVSFMSFFIIIFIAVILYIIITIILMRIFGYYKELSRFFLNQF